MINSNKFSDAAGMNVQQAQPEFIRIPRNKERDPIFGQTRSFWYKVENKGLICFKRFRLSGQRNGITLIPVEAAREMFRKLTAPQPIVHNPAANR